MSSRPTSTTSPTCQPLRWPHKMTSLVRPELPTASVGSSHAPTAAVDNSAPSATRPQSTYKSGKAVQTSGATSLFINAAEHFDKGKRQNQLKPEHIAKIIKTYQFREEEARYSRKVEMAEIEKNDFNLNISRYISTAVGEAEIDLDETHQELVEIKKAIAVAKDKHSAFLRELG